MPSGVDDLKGINPKSELVLGQLIEVVSKYATTQSVNDTVTGAVARNG